MSIKTNPMLFVLLGSNTFHCMCLFVCSFPFMIYHQSIRYAIGRKTDPRIWQIILFFPSSADSRRASCQLLAKELAQNTGKLPSGGLPKNNVLGN